MCERERGGGGERERERQREREREREKPQVGEYVRAGNDGQVSLRERVGGDEVGGCYIEVPYGVKC